MIEKMNNLSLQFAAIPEAKVKLNSFPSGAAVIDVIVQDRLFVMDYSPTRFFGVDEVKDDEGYLISYRFTSKDFESAAANLWELVRGAQSAGAIEANGSMQNGSRLHPLAPMDQTSPTRTIQ